MRELKRYGKEDLGLEELFAHGTSGPTLKHYKKAIALTANKKASADSTITHTMSLEGSRNAPGITEKGKAMGVTLKP